MSKDYPNPEHLQVMATYIDTEKVQVHLSEEEKISLNKDFVEVSKSIYSLEEEKRLLLESIKYKLKPFQKNRQDLIEKLTDGYVLEETEVYGIVDDGDETIMNYYKKDGTYLRSRKRSRSEMSGQPVRTIFNPKTQAM